MPLLLATGCSSRDDTATTGRARRAPTARAVPLRYADDDLDADVDAAPLLALATIILPSSLSLSLSLSLYVCVCVCVHSSPTPRPSFLLILSFRVHLVMEGETLLLSL